MAKKLPTRIVVFHMGDGDAHGLDIALTLASQLEQHGIEIGWLTVSRMQIEKWKKKFDLQSKGCSETDMKKIKSLLNGPGDGASRDDQRRWLQKKNTKLWQSLQYQIEAIESTGKQMKLDMVFDRVDTEVLRQVFRELLEKRLGLDVSMMA
mmetsp:Transcript_5380/g.12649  ORF Transcript_5380/g.12649 Transcript_5380/m.12649 type:complete len:151 (+) Transcript_5380:1552-2004(+)